ncbi:MAG: hypothetical protein ACREKE_07635, partial [bacterium]
FIFATTVAGKVPPTIMSRTQRFDFRRVGAAEVAGQLSKILTAEGLDASDEALRLVARAGEGSVRDSQTLLDQVISYTLIGSEKRALRAEDVLAVLGGVQEGQAWTALKAALRGDLTEALGWLQEQYQRGADLRQVLEAFQSLLRGLLLLKAAPGGGADTDLLPETVVALAAAAPDLGLSRLFTALKACAEAETGLRYGGQGRLALELLLLELAPGGPSAGLGDIVDELRDLERRFRTLPAGAEQAAAVLPEVGPPVAAVQTHQAVQAGVAQTIPAPVVDKVKPMSPVSPALADPTPAGPDISQAPAASGTHDSSVPATPPVSSESATAPLTPPGAGEPVSAVQSVDELSEKPDSAPSLESLSGDWEAMVSELQQQSLKLASAAKDAGLKAFDGGLLTLKAVNAFQRKVLEEPAEKARLEEALSRRQGRTIRVRIVFEPPLAKGGPKAGPPDKAEIERLLAERPELRRVQELFGAEIIEITGD